MIVSVLNGFKISDIDQLIILALVSINLELGLFCSTKLDVKFSCVFFRYKDTY